MQSITFLLLWTFSGTKSTTQSYVHIVISCLKFKPSFQMKFGILTKNDRIPQKTVSSRYFGLEVLLKIWVNTHYCKGFTLIVYDSVSTLNYWPITIFFYKNREFHKDGLFPDPLTIDIEHRDLKFENLYHG